MSGTWDQPGLFTTIDGRSDAMTAKDFWNAGYRWIVGQAQNGEKLQDVDLSAFKAVGFKTGVWGVTYDKDVFVRDAAALAMCANGHDILIMDAEECLKNADPLPLIRACSIFKGEKALSTLGAASGQNVFPIDWKPFIDAGWDLLAQAYPSWSLDYTPQRCLDHWVHRAGLPIDRFHLTLDSSDEFQSKELGGMGRAAMPRELVGFLRETKITTPDISIFMAEFGDKTYYETLKEITMQVAPPAITSADETRQAMLDLGLEQEKRWRAAKVPSAKIAESRIGIADGILSLGGHAFTEKLPNLLKALR